MYKPQLHPAITIIIFAFLALLLPLFALADSPNYATIIDSDDAEVMIKYRSPSDSEYWRCNVASNKCSQVKSGGGSEPNLGKGNILPNTIQSQDKSVRVSLITPRSGNATIVFATTSNGPRFYLLNQRGITTDNIKISENNKYVVAKTSNELVQLDLAKSMKSTAVVMGTTPYRLFNISPDGNKAGMYSDTASHYLLADFTNNRIERISSSSGSLPEFSETGSYVALLTRPNYHVLSVYEFKKNKTDLVSSKINRDGVITDYLWLADKLYYVSNESGPYDWNLHRYNPSTDKSEVVSSNVSYNEYMKRIDGNILFYEIKGEMTDVKRVSNEEAPIKLTNKSPEPGYDISRQAAKFAGKSGVILKNKDDDNDEEKDLYVWLHGGPQRQTSLNYHPYFSYAVYDQILEKLVSDKDSRVLKLDYLGSYGYGKNFMDQLVGQVGVGDINDVARAIDEFKKDYEVDNVYLIGNSYGGYLAMRALSSIPNKIDGAISINGVADWANLITEIPSSPFTTQFGGPVNSNTIGRYLSASSYLKSNKIDDPILIIYGNKDTTVPPRQSIKFHNYLKSINKDSQLVELTGEGHIIVERKSLDKLYDLVADFN